MELETRATRRRRALCGHVVEAKLAEYSDRLRVLEARQLEDLLHAGRLLDLARGLVAPAQFEAWLQEEFGWTLATAELLIKLTEALGQCDRPAGLQPAAALALFHGKTPEGLRETMLRKARRGQRVTFADVQQQLTSPRNGRG